MSKLRHGKVKRSLKLKRLKYTKLANGKAQTQTQAVELQI